MSKTVVGIFEYSSEAQEAQKYLLENGFSQENIDINTAPGHSVSDYNDEPVKREHSSDGIGNFFRNLFSDDDDEVNRYSEAGRKGTVLTVHARTEDEAEMAVRILDNYGAVDVDDFSSSDYKSTSKYAAGSNDLSSADYASANYASGADEFKTNDFIPGTDALGVTGYSTTSDDLKSEDDFRTSEDSDVIPVIEEELIVGKREVQTGGVRLRSRIVERQVEENIRLRQENVVVERTPVDRVATEADFDTFKEGTIEVKEYAELPVVSKEARVVEEVSLSKTIDEKNETVSDTVRSTEVETEDITDEEGMRKSGLDL